MQYENPFAPVDEAGDNFTIVDSSQLGIDESEASLVAGCKVGEPMARRHPLLLAGDLLTALEELPASIAMVVFFFDGPEAPQSAGAMVKSFVESGVEVVSTHQLATQAVKRIDNGLVVESVDRSTISALTAPIVIDRHRLQSALGDALPLSVVDPARLVIAQGGSAIPFPPP